MDASCYPVKKYNIIEVVPSVYETMSGAIKYSYQYTYAHKEYLSYHHTGRVIPAIWFRYEMQPITVKYTEQRQKSFDSFITSVCFNISFSCTTCFPLVLYQ